jgi:hypothetical protein
MTPEQFLAAATEVAQRFPGTVLVRNQVGNLAIVDELGEMVGRVDLSSGEVENVE